MSFSLTQLIEARQADQYDLHMKYISPHMARVQKIIGFDKPYTHGTGAYLREVDGNRYLDLLSGYSVFNLGRGHPVIKQAMEEALMLDRPNLVKMDCPLLAGPFQPNIVIEFMPMAVGRLLDDMICEAPINDWVESLELEPLTVQRCRENCLKLIFR